MVPILCSTIDYGKLSWNMLSHEIFASSCFDDGKSAMNFQYNGKPKMVSINATSFVRRSIALDFPNKVVEILNSTTFNLKWKWWKSLPRGDIALRFYPLMGRKKTFIKYTLNYFQETLVMDRKGSIETLAEELEPVA